MSTHTARGRVVVWLAASAGAAAAFIFVRIALSRAAALGLAAGLLFANGDISAKLVTSGGIWLLALLSLIATTRPARAFSRPRSSTAAR